MLKNTNGQDATRDESLRENYHSSFQKMKVKFVLIIFTISSFYFMVSNCIAQALPYSLDPDRKLSQYILGKYSTDDGLPSNILHHIHRTKEGYIWISTYNGLVRFDGTKFRVFNRQNTDIFDTDAFSVFAEDVNGKLFIGTYGKGVYTFQNGVFAKLGNKKFNEVVESILIDADGNIWIGTRNSGLFTFKDGLYIKMFKDSDKINSGIITMLQKKRGEIYFGTNTEGVFIYQNGLIQPVQENFKLKGKTVFSLTNDDSGTIWVGTIRGLYRLDGKQIRAVEALKKQYITKVFKDEYANLWVSAMNGIFRKGKNSEWQNVTIKENIANFNDIVFDNEGTMWIASFREGLFYLKDGKITNYSDSDGIEGGVTGVIELENNNFLIGSRTGRLYNINSSGVKPVLLKTSLSTGYLMHIFRDSKGNTLISTTEGILKISPDKSETWLTRDLGFGEIFVRMVFEDSRNNLWIGTNKKGLIKLSTDKKLINFNSSNGLSGNMIMSISEDLDGKILVGTAGGGLSIISNESIKNHSTKNGFPSNTIFFTYTDNVGTTWIASNSGLIRFRDNTFFTFSKKNGFPSNTVYRVLEDVKGDFWATSNSQIIRVARKSLDDAANGKRVNLEYKIYDKHNGIKQPEFTTVSNILKAKDGSLWFGSTSMLIKIEPDKLPFNYIKPPVYIERMTADNYRVNLNEIVALEPETKRIRFNYAALHYFAPAKIRFKYKLEGYENEWTEVGNIRSVSYTNLSHGNYTFRVIASNNDGVWNEKGDKLSFSVKPYWYEMLLFRILFILLIVGFIYLVFKFRVRQLKKSHTKLEQIVKERTADIVSQKEEIHTQALELKVSYKEIKDKNKKLSDYITELKVLRGIVPICASCKKIRDQEGHWDHVETYIEKHSEAQFSHGICKECELKLYGKEKWYKDRGK